MTINSRDEIPKIPLKKEILNSKWRQFEYMR